MSKESMARDEKKSEREKERRGKRPKTAVSSIHASAAVHTRPQQPDDDAVPSVTAAAQALFTDVRTCTTVQYTVYAAVMERR